MFKVAFCSALVAPPKNHSQIFEIGVGRSKTISETKTVYGVIDEKI